MHFRSRAEIESLPARIAEFALPESIDATRRTLVRQLLSSNMDGDYFSFRKFNADRADDRARVASLLESLNACLPGFVREFQDGTRATDAGA